MCLYNDAKTTVRVGSAYSEELEVKVGVHQKSMLLPLLFAIVMNVITENVRRGVVNKLLYADDLGSHEQNHGKLKGKILKWKGCTKDLKINTRKTKVTVSGLKGKLFKSTIDPCGVCGRVMDNFM